MKTNYEKQATDFLEKTGCKMTITFKENRKYFPEDKETRDVYDVKIERGKRKFKFEFGNSIADSQYYQDLQFSDRKYTLNGGCLTGRYRIVDMDRYSTYIKLMPGKSPSEYSILSCLTKYDPESFENFCSEYGYDEDSRTAERTYNAVVKEWQNVCMIWADDEIEELREIN